VHHPAEYYLKFLIVRHPDWDDAAILKNLANWGILPPPSWDEHYFSFLRADMPKTPEDFDPLDMTHRPSVMYLRKLGIYEMFRDTPEMQEAWDILSTPDQRLTVEQIILSRLDLKMAAQRVNKKQGWFLSEDGIKTFRHYFWNTKLLTFDDWGRYLYGRAALYERWMALLSGDARVALHHLRIDQAVESKLMIQRSQEIAYACLEEVDLKPGTGPDKVKAIAVLTKAVVECHEALSTSDMALKDVLKQFERFRMEHPHQIPPDIRLLAPLGNFSGGGAAEKDEAKKNGKLN
jgi:hypothetical protein